VLVGAACLMLTQLSVDGGFPADVFLGLLIFGTGLGAAFVASQIAALDGVPEHESGLAAGLVDTSFSMGGALGLAVLSTVAVSRANEMLEGTGRSQQLVAVTEGFRSAFVVALAFPLLGFVAAMLLLGRRRAAGRTPVQTSPITDGETSNEE
jgi:hypothetical protein